METHRGEQAQGGREAEGGLRAGAGLGSPGVRAVLGKEVCLPSRGRSAAEDNQDWEPGPPPRGTPGQRHQREAQNSQAGAACSSVGTRNNPQQPWVPVGLTDMGGPRAHCRKGRVGTPPGRGLAGVGLGQWDPLASQERGCRAKGREVLLRVQPVAVAGVAALLPQGASPGGLGEKAEADGGGACHQLDPGKLWASSPHPGASPHGPGADGTTTSWRRSFPGMFPRTPRPPGISQP